MKFERRTALVVIDVQNYFFKKDAPARIRGTERIISIINNLIKKFEMKDLPIVFTKQIYPEDKRHPMRQWWRRLPAGEECKLYNELYVPDNSILIEKECYSAFFRTSLDKILKNSNIRRLFFCGVMTHLCVESSIRDAFMLGYDTFLIEDATLSKNKAHHKASILNLSHGFSKIIKSGEVNDYI